MRGLNIFYNIKGIYYSRKIIDKIIEFCVYAEEYKKDLFNKSQGRKEIFWLVTVGIIDYKFYDHIAQNDKQWEEWEKHLKLSSLAGGNIFYNSLYTKEQRINFLKENPGLAIDTRYFDASFVNDLLKQIETNKNEIDGLLISGDNWFVINNLLQDYKNKIKCVYIDPPYNAKSDSIYSDSYIHSSWLSMMLDRLAAIYELIREDGFLFISIDENELYYLKVLVDNFLGSFFYLNNFVWINHINGRQMKRRGAAGTHEYILAFGKKKSGKMIWEFDKLKKIMPSIYKGIDRQILKDDLGYYILSEELANHYAAANEKTRPNLVFNIHYNFETGEIKFSNIDDKTEYEGFVKIPPKKNSCEDYKYFAWRWSKNKIIKEKHNLFFRKEGDVVKIYIKKRDLNKATLKDIIIGIRSSMANKELIELFGYNIFRGTAKPILLPYIFATQASDDEYVADFFAGTGTTAHAVIKLNREDKKRRKFILVEHGPHFNDIIIPRIKKIIFATEWGNGRPKKIVDKSEYENGPKIIKIINKI